MLTRDPDDLLNINVTQKPCRACDIIIGFALFIPLGTFVVLIFTGTEPGLWEMLSVIIGLPLAYVGMRVLFLTERSRRMGLLPPWVLYATGLAMMTVPFFTNSAWACVGFGPLFILAAKRRQVIRAQLQAEEKAEQKNRSIHEMSSIKTSEYGRADQSGH